MAINISDVEPRVQYTATSGQTSFTVPFEFFVNADLKVYNGTTLLSFAASPADATEYSVTGAGVTGGGSITLGGSGATLNDIITISRDIAISRTTDFPTSGAFQIASLNEELDKIVAMCGQLERDLKFSPRAAATTSNTFNITFPNLVANKVLNVNSLGTGLEFSVDKTDVATVAGISSDVSTVSGIASNVTTVAGGITNINTVASNIASVNTVATNIADIITVANDLNEAVSEIETVASDLQEASPEIDLVAGSIANVNTVGGAIANVNIVAPISANVTTVAGIAANVTTVAGISSNVSTVAPISANVTTVAGISSDVTSVAGISSNVTSVASNSSNINTVAGSISNVNLVGGSIANVNTVASNISSVNSFANQYRVGSSDPSTSLDAGDLAYNTTGNVLKYYNGSSWVAITSGGITDVAQDSTPQLGGNLDLNGNDITGTGGIPSANLTGTIAEARLPASALGAIWESKNANFTAEARKNYFVDTSSATVTATLPTSATIGDEIHFLDVAGTFDQNYLTIDRNSHKIQGDASDMTVNLERAGFTLVYYNATEGWLLKDV